MEQDHRERHRQLLQRHVEAAALAGTLVGLSREEAEERVSAAGFYAQVLTPDVKVVSADLRFERVRIRVDEAGVVIEGHAG